MTRAETAEKALHEATKQVKRLGDQNESITLDLQVSNLQTNVSPHNTARPRKPLVSVRKLARHSYSDCRKLYRSRALILQLSPFLR